MKQLPGQPGEDACQPADRPAGPRATVHRVTAEVLESERLPGEHHRLLLRAPRIAEDASPGQFIHVWCHPPEEIDRPPTSAILRRPLSISRLRPPDGVEVLLRVRGVGGRILAGTPRGAQLDILGPMGRGFRMPPSMRTALVVAGGIGIAPVPFLVQRLAAALIETVVLVGAARDDSLPYHVERTGHQHATLPGLAALGAEVTFVSEQVDAILVSELLERRLPDFDAASTEIMAIGPRAMVKRIAAVAGGRLPVQVSLEERMACGLGACRSCVVPVTPHSNRPIGPGTAGFSLPEGLPPGPNRPTCPAGPTLDSSTPLGPDALAKGTRLFAPSYHTVCHDGPVFYSSEIDWEHLDP